MGLLSPCTKACARPVSAVNAKGPGNVSCGMACFLQSTLLNASYRQCATCMLCCRYATAYSRHVYLGSSNQSGYAASKTFFPYQCIELLGHPGAAIRNCMHDATICNKRIHASSAQGTWVLVTYGAISLIRSCAKAELAASSAPGGHWYNTKKWKSMSSASRCKGSTDRHYWSKKPM